MPAHTVEDLSLLRVDQVGSLVVPAELAAASDRRLRGEMSDNDLRETEDKAIRAVMRKQEQVGLPILTDGEFRRRNFQDSFGNAVSGYDTPSLAGADPKRWRDPNKPGSRTEPNYEAAGPAIATRRATTERLKLKKNVVLNEYKAAAAMTQRPVKVSLIGPDRIAQRFAWEKSKAIYSGLDEFIADVVAIQRQMIRELVDAGCRYVHMDAPGFTAYVDKVSLERMKARGEDPDQNLDRAIRAENAVIEGFPGVTFGPYYPCRGNPRGVDSSGKVQAQWAPRGPPRQHQPGKTVQPVEAPAAASGIRQRTRRGASMRCASLSRKGTVAVLGVVTTKSEQVEQVDAMKRRVEMAAQYLSVEQLAVSPQCGFSSGIGGPQLSESAEWGKFETLIKTAEAIWGHV